MNKHFMVVALLATQVVVSSSTVFGFQKERGGRESVERTVGSKEATIERTAAVADRRKSTEFSEAPGWRVSQRDFGRIDSYAKENRSKIDVKISGDLESTGTLKVKVERDAESSNLVKQEYLFDLSIIIGSVPDSIINQIMSAILLRRSSVGQLEGVKVKQRGSSPYYEVVDDYTYDFGNHKITVPKGFVYDRASIPRVFWLLVDKDSLSNVAPLFHDLLYKYGGRLQANLVSPYRTFNREETDKLFLELMTKCGVDEWRRAAAYEAVRNFSGSYWNDN